jgi:hypothetical protein
VQKLPNLPLANYPSFASLSNRKEVFRNINAQEKEIVMNQHKSLFVRIKSKVYGFLPKFGASPVQREKYRFAVAEIANSKKDRRFLNGEEWHAEIVAGMMVSHAKNEEVLIYSDSLGPEFYAKILLNSYCSFRILLGNVGNSRALDVIRALPQEAQSRIDFRVSNAPYGKHFLVVGDSIRCEADDDGNELFVVCNFNEPDAAQRLRDRFESMWEKSPPWSFLY